MSRLFSGALNLDSDQRKGYLDHECGDDQDLRQEVEGLLARHAEANVLFETANLQRQQAQHLTEASALLQDPELIGSYRILRRLGQGGMGIVYLAEQTEPVRRQVAIKVIRLGMHTEQVIARFLAERQALAILEHDGIARLLDAGADDQGRPYFVMELVEGESIVRYADERRLTLPQRLDLLARVCDVVQYAHQRGVLHRDLKPANILVREIADHPVVKIIDFGIARIIDDEQPALTLMTAEGQMVGTPEYMSPEQIDSECVADTRSDVFALGVVLFDLITGGPPRRLTSKSPAALGNFIREITQTAQPSPGKQLAKMEATKRAHLSEQRNTTWGQLTKHVRGDLDWIALKATAPEPERRYNSAAAMAEDLRAYIEERPVKAAPPGTRYRMGKFVRRHRAMVVGVTLLVATLLIGTATTTWQAVRATRQVERLERVQDFLVDGFLLAPTPAGYGRDVKVSELLDRATEDAAIHFVDDSLTLATVQRTLGLTYGDLGFVKRSEELLRSAVELWLESGQSHELLDTQEDLARNLIGQERLEEATSVMMQVVDQRIRRQGPRARATLAAQALLASSLTYERYVEAESMLTVTLATQEAILGPDSPDLIVTLGLLAETMSFHSDSRMRADSLLVQAHGLSIRIHGPDHVITLGLEAHRARNLMNAGSDIGGTLDLLDSLLPRITAVWGEQHLETLGLRAQRVAAFQNLGRLDEAESELHDLIPLTEASLGRGHPLHHSVTMSMCINHSARNRWDAADSVAAVAMDLARIYQPDRHDIQGFIAAQRSDLSHRLGREDEAGEFFDLAFRLLGELYGETAWYPQTLMRQRCSLLIEAGRFDEAENLLLESKSAMLQEHGSFDGSSQFTVYQLEELWLLERRFDEVEAMLLEYEQALAEADKNSAVLLEIRRHLLWFYEDTGNATEAARYLPLVGDSPRTVPLNRF